MQAFTNYLLHLVLACILLAIFFKIYTFTTPFNEVLLIRQGNNAAALSLSGSLLGFSLTMASSVMHTADYQQFVAWSVAAMVVQVVVYAVTSRVLRLSKEHIESGNTAFGGLMGAISLATGAVNAACIS